MNVFPPLTPPGKMSKKTGSRWQHESKWPFKISHCGRRSKVDCNPLFFITAFFFYHKLSMCTNDQLLFWIIFTPPPPSLFLHLSLHPDRKLKKLVRAIKDKGSAEEEREEERPPQQWNLDYALAPFEGLTPEYMEMSESALKHSCLLCLMLLSL